MFDSSWIILLYKKFISRLFLIFCIFSSLLSFPKLFTRQTKYAGFSELTLINVIVFSSIYEDSNNRKLYGENCFINIQAEDIKS
ncbi:072R [Invertebrate iridescent virus Kaz2018]|uniref:072R n=1 Tax=Invertebrate iridescent virus 6 TaxID=176652 RepID=Q91G36_IIV6|nr:072R [Invertebrate iridescent virus 6]AAK81996.1 072R [Invertebrate iridescent virus 6]QMS79490.1 hypothetical protein IIV6-T1_076 [Invertebrate iridescent virus 6]QNH08484.1 072R [Invertebrate iridescent virus Kaz2018]